jgi:isopenicillin N synthase-like dioxygenase
MTAYVPLLDLDRWRNGSARDRTGLAADLDRALRESGFLLVENHGVSAELKAEIRRQSRRFFVLPDAVKEPYATPVMGRGWIAKGREANAFYGEAADPARADLKETYVSGRVYATGDAAVDAEWFAPNVWPAEVPELKAVAEEYAAAVEAVNTDLLEICATALELPADWFVARSLQAPYDFNITRYPAWHLTGNPVEGQYRIAPHTDWGVLTVLDREPGYAGLQIQTLEGAWVDAPFVPNAFTINIGDLLARWTGDRWRSTRHRVLPPSPEAPDEELISLVMFFEADVDTVVESFPPPLGKTAGYEPVAAGAYLRSRSDAATVAP